MNKKSHSEVESFVLDLFRPLFIEKSYKSGEGIEIEVEKTPKGFNITASDMYESPINADLDTLMKLADIFGTRKIDVDDYSQRGCESCDYGSAYGFTFNIIEPTKNIPPF